MAAVFRIWIYVALVTLTGTALASPLLEIDAPKSSIDDGLRLLPAKFAKLAPAKKAAIPRVASFHDESRVFWYATGAGAATALGVRILSAIPLVALAGASSAFVGPGVLAILGATALVLTLIETSLAAFTATAVFNNMSRYYRASYWASWIGQLGGAALSNGVMGLLFGFGHLSFLGVESLEGIVAGGILNSIQIASILGAMPAVVVAFFVSLAVPSMIGAWSMAATATTRTGFVVDEDWYPFGKRTLVPLLPRDKNRHAQSVPLWTAPLSGT